MIAFAIFLTLIGGVLIGFACGYTLCSIHRAVAKADASFPDYLKDEHDKWIKESASQ